MSELLISARWPATFKVCRKPKGHFSSINDPWPLILQPKKKKKIVQRVIFQGAPEAEGGLTSGSEFGNEPADVL